MLKINFGFFCFNIIFSIAGRLLLAQDIGRNNADYENLIISPNNVDVDNKKYDDWTFQSYSDVEKLVGNFTESNEFGHHNYNKMTLWLKRLNLDYPDITHLYTVGKSVQGRDLWVLIISDNPKEHEPGAKKVSSKVLPMSNTDFVSF